MTKKVNRTLNINLRFCLASLVAQSVKSLLAMQETWVRSLVREDPLEKEMATHSNILQPEESHGWRSLAGYSLWGRKESDMTEQPTHASRKLQIQEILNLIDPISVSRGQALSTPRVFGFE